MARNQVCIRLAIALLLTTGIACRGAVQRRDVAPGEPQPAKTAPVPAVDDQLWYRGLDGNGIDIRPRALSGNVLVEHEHLATAGTSGIREVNDYWVTNQSAKELVLQIPAHPTGTIHERTLQPRSSLRLRYEIRDDGIVGHDLFVRYDGLEFTVNQTDSYQPSVPPIPPVSLRARGSPNVTLRFAVFGYTTDVALLWR